MTKLAFVILGEPASKANSREIVTRGGTMAMVGGRRTMVGGRPMVIKSEKGRNYEYDAIRQIPPEAKKMLQGDLAISIRIFYASERPDLDESILLDVLQAKFEKDPNGARILARRGVYHNDRQIREKHIYHAIDKRNPRAEIEVWPIGQVQADMLAA